MSTLLEQASLVLIPSGYKEDTVYSVIPSNGSGDMSFTRASDGTRINSDGLVENTPWNLLQQSEAISTSPWTLTRATVTTNSINSPTGTLTADTLISSVTGTDGSWARQILSAINGSFSLSIYAKQLTSSFLQIRLDGLGAVIFDLSNGTIKSSNVGIVGSIVAVGSDGWYRCSISGTATGQTTLLYIVGNSSMNLVTWNSTIGDSIYLWGAQLNIGSTAKPYFPTTDRLNVPRLTYQNGGGGCPSLLLEPQRTNLALYSEDFSNAYWPKLNSTITANSITSPDGTVNADKLIADATTNLHRINISVFSGVALTSNTLSIFAKKGEYNFFYFRESISGTTVETFFDLNNGTITSIGAGRTANITSFGNGWYRCSVTATSTGFNFGIGFGLAQTDGVSSFLGNGTSGIYIWGAQVEAGAYPSSYIPTVASSATRIEDVCSKTGISSLIGQTEGTIFLDFQLLPNNTNSRYLFALNDGTTLNMIKTEIYIASPTISQFRTGVSTLGVGQSDLFNTITQLNNKMAISYSLNNLKIFINGVLVNTDTSVTIPTMNTFNIGNRTLDLIIASNYKQAVLFKTQLTNAECIALTTL